MVIPALNAVYYTHKTFTRVVCLLMAGLGQGGTADAAVPRVIVSVGLLQL